ncbi:hypothetical protein E3N88_16679 [Mikania micrantha]|uniref:Uncharacterized protein n=1 Tax=Mikania micrantha TaxID=192012 RepID=A0A5N6NYY2_9ASTR|nr:hypothetical protein E3N88_16670 [Mikania micrantha]KAD5508976.1 hypothetical protein E3N88_16679 [Mikania micrantha]
MMVERKETLEDPSFQQHVDMQYDVHNGDSDDDDDYGNFDNSEDYISEYFTKIEVIPLANEYDDADANETPSTVQYNTRICQGFSKVPVFYSNDVEPIG